MLQSRIEDRIGSVIKLGVHQIKGWKLVFNSGTFSSHANIVRSEGSVVTGILYELFEGQVRELDAFEGCPFFYEKRIFNVPNMGQAILYISVNPRLVTDKLPTIEYINYLVEGALENNLIPLYNELVTYKLEEMKVKKCKHKLI